MARNITKVYLLSVPLENDYRDTLYFANATAQQTYFAGQVVKSYTDFSYQRKDSVIRVPAIVDSIRNCNYVMYQNTAYSNKWFYAFINRMVYVDDGRTDIYISTDVLQTWMFEMQFKDSYIEREHVNDDTVGLHTLPEGLETGEFVCNDIVDFRYANTYNFPNSVSDATMMAVVLVTSLVFKYNNSTKAPEKYLEGPTWNMTNSVPQGLNVIGIPVCKATLPGLYVLKGYYDGNGRGEAINSMFLMPLQSAWAWLPYTEHINGSDETSSKFFYPVDSEGANNTIANIDGEHSTSFTISMNSTLNGYTPKNNKCKTSPFNYFTITNNDGAEIAFAYENFLSTPTFKVIGSFEQGGSFMCIPTNSKKTTTANSNINGWTEGIPGGKFPQLSWTSDYYLNWQAQNGKYLEVTDTLNAVNFGANLIGSLAGGFLGSMASTSSYGAGLNATMTADVAEAKEKWLRSSLDTSGGITSGTGAVGAITEYAGSIANSMQQRRLARMTPEQAKGNASTGTLSYATNAVGRYTARKMSCRYEYIKAVDDYFSMFGYKVNRLGIPLSNHRQNYWYTKTIGANIDGNIPNEDMEIIKRIYNNGVTYWKNPANIKNYSVSNNIVS